jgi:hypothetical protein
LEDALNRCAINSLYMCVYFHIRTEHSPLLQSALRVCEHIAVSRRILLVLVKYARQSVMLSAADACHY